MKNTLSTSDRHELAVGRFKFGATGLGVTGDPTYEEWEECGAVLKKIEGAVHWWIGDWLNYGEGKWGEKYVQAMDDTGLAEQTLTNDKYIASKVEFSRRRENLSFAHHAEVASLTPAQQDKVLAEAVKKDWNRAEIRDKVRAVKNGRNGHEPAVAAALNSLQVFDGDMLEVLAGLEAGTADLLVADPPYNVTGWAWDEAGSPGEFMALTRDWLTACRRVMRPEYTAFWFCSPRYAADIEMVMRDLNLPIKSRVVWHRRNMSMGSDARDKFVDTWEMIFHFGNRPLNWPLTDTGGEAWDDRRFDVQTFAVPQTNFTDRKLHPTQKPLDLIRRLVEFGSQPGDMVLDPFAGSGTTGHACALAPARRCLMVERDPEFSDIIRSRLGIP